MAGSRSATTFTQPKPPISICLYESRYLLPTPPPSSLLSNMIPISPPSYHYHPLNRSLRAQSTPAPSHQPHISSPSPERSCNPRHLIKLARTSSAYTRRVVFPWKVKRGGGSEVSIRVHPQLSESKVWNMLVPEGVQQEEGTEEVCKRSSPFSHCSRKRLNQHKHRSSCLPRIPHIISTPGRKLRLPPHIRASQPVQFPAIFSSFRFRVL